MQLKQTQNSHKIVIELPVYLLTMHSLEQCHTGEKILFCVHTYHENAAFPFLVSKLNTVSREGKH